MVWPLQHYLVEETVVSYLDVRRRVRNSLKHVYLTGPRLLSFQWALRKRKDIKITIIISFLTSFLFKKSFCIYCFLKFFLSFGPRSKI